MKFQASFIYAALLLSLIVARPMEDKVNAARLLNAVNQFFYRGGGTYFFPKTQGGPYGACGPYEDNNSQIVALNAAQYGPLDRKSKWCGKKVKICHHEKCTIATITDACPKCRYGGLDLTPAVWDQLNNDRSRGVLDIVWALLDTLEKMDDPKSTEQKPAEKKPTEQKPAEQKSVEKKPVEKKPAEQKPTEQKPVEKKPAEQKPAEQKPAEQKPAEQKPAEQKPAEQKPAEQKPAEQKPAEQKPAEQKPTEKKSTKKKNEESSNEEEEDNTDDDEDEDEDDENE